MFCTTLLLGQMVAGHCMFACLGDLDEFRRYWGIRYDNIAQAVVDDHGPVAALRRAGDDVIWSIEAEPSACYPVPALKPERP